MEHDERSPFERSCDLFGDRTFICHFTHTHSPGSICIEVRNGERFAIITGDNAYNRHSWEEGRLPIIVTDRDKFRRALGWIDGRAEDPSCVAVLATHEPEVPAGVIEL